MPQAGSAATHPSKTWSKTWSAAGGAAWDVRAAATARHVSHAERIVWSLPRRPTRLGLLVLAPYTVLLQREHAVAVGVLIQERLWGPGSGGGSSHGDGWKEGRWRREDGAAAAVQGSAVGAAWRGAGRVIANIHLGAGSLPWGGLRVPRRPSDPPRKPIFASLPPAPG